jgi:hypothetical protein
MAYQPETQTYETGIYQLEITDPVEGGVGGLSNTPLLQLANRTAWLYQELNLLLDGSVIPSTVAPLDSAHLTGTPLAPTPALGDNSTKIATTAFVQGTVNGTLTKSVAGGANVTLSAVEAGNGVLNLTGALTANIAVIVPAAGKWTVVNGTSGAYTLTVKTASGTGVVVTQGRSQNLWCDGTNVYQQVTDFISPAMTGTPTAPTATAGTSTTQVATTAFVQSAKNGATTVNVAGNTNVALTAAQAGVGIILLTGALTGAITVTVPAGTGQYIFANNTTGSYTLRIGVAGSGGATAIVPQNQSVVAYSDATNIVLAGAASSSSFTRYSFTATAGQKVFNGVYTVGNVLVLVNGAVQAPSDITATDSATVTLTAYNGGAGCVAGDDVEIIAFASFTVANAMTLAGGTFVGPIMLAGGDTGITPPQFDTSTKLATMAAVQRALGNISGTLAINSNTTLTAAQVGQFINLYGTGTVLTLPAISSVPSGSTFTIWCSSGVTCSLASQGSDKIYLSASPSTTALMGAGDFVTLVAQPGVGGSGAGWTITNGSIGLKNTPGFASALGAPGYQKLPSGLIFQWGYSVGSSGGVATQVFPLAFPNNCLSVVATHTSGATVSAVFANIYAIVASQFQFITCTSSGYTADGVFWFAVGY